MSSFLAMGTSVKSLVCCVVSCPHGEFRKTNAQTRFGIAITTDAEHAALVTATKLQSELSIEPAICRLRDCNLIALNQTAVFCSRLFMFTAFYLHLHNIYSYGVTRYLA